MLLIVIQVKGGDLVIRQIVDEIALGDDLLVGGEALVDQRNDADDDGDGQTVGQDDLEIALHFIPPFVAGILYDGLGWPVCEHAPQGTRIQHIG